jgi:hypothetical protein
LRIPNRPQFSIPKWSGVASARRALATTAPLSCTTLARPFGGLKARRSTFTVEFIKAWYDFFGR